PMADVATVNRVIENLRMLAISRAALAIDNPNPADPLRGKVALTLLGQGPDGRWREATPGADGWVTFRAGDGLALRITNGHSAPVFVIVLDFGPTGHIEPIYPPPGARVALPPGVLDYGVRPGEELALRFPEGFAGSERVESLKLFAATRPIDFGWPEQEGRRGAVGCRLTSPRLEASLGGGRRRGSGTAAAAAGHPIHPGRGHPLAMSLRRIELFHVAVPLKRPIRHASHERATSDSLVVRATLAGGHVGHGEGVPRPYVTGETIASTFSALAGVDAAGHLGDPDDYTEVVWRVEQLTLPGIEADPRGMNGNAARCALELALLDAYGRRFGRSVTQAVRQVEGTRSLLADAPGPVRYSGAITAETARRERIAAWKMRLYGFAQVKVKVGVAGQDDPARLSVLRRILGRGMDLRLDANEAWPAAGLREMVRPLLPFRPTALEQPVPHAEVAALAELRPGLGVPVMLDESLCGYPDAVRAVEERTADLFNVRLSKCGGIAPTLRIVGLARGAGLGVQLGCHPGETGLLSAAGRHVACNLAGLRYVEGSYDRHVLAENLVAEDITFGYGGRAGPLTGPGLGVRVDEAALERMTVARREIRYD
ncbi:MAG TPA: enolase C-terminal domain-like protein, partial [Isosphaeraceae bacterium]